MALRSLVSILFLRLDQRAGSRRERCPPIVVRAPSRTVVEALSEGKPDAGDSGPVSSDQLG